MASLTNYYFMDPAGQVAVGPIVAEVMRDFHDGCAIICGRNEDSDKDSKAGFVDKSGKVIVSFSFFGLTDFSDGVAVYRPDFRGPVGLIAADGTRLTEAIYEAIAPVSDDLGRRAELNGKVGWIGTDGQIKIDFKYPYASPFHEGLAAVKTDDGKSGFMDVSGNMVLEYPFEASSGFHEGLAFVKVGTRRWKVIDVKGNEVIPEFEAFSHIPFENGVAFICEPGEYRPINRKGEPLNKDVYTEAGKWHEGVMKVQKGKKTVYLKPDGKKVKGSYDDGSDFCNGWACVRNFRQDDKYIDIKGNALALGVEGPLWSAQEFSEGLATCVVRGVGTYVINPQGEVLFKVPKGYSVIGEYHDGLLKLQKD